MVFNHVLINPYVAFIFNMLPFKNKIINTKKKQ